MSSVLLLNNRLLREVAVNVEASDLEQINSELLPQMVKAMQEEKGIGLAANQIGRPVSVFILDIDSNLEIFLNPEVLEESEETTHEEGCLSIPGVTAQVARFNKVKLKYRDEKFEEKEKEFVGLSAFAVQHEMDHLNGTLYIDHLGEVTKSLLIQRHRKFVKMLNRINKR